MTNILIFIAGVVCGLIIGFEITFVILDEFYNRRRDK